MLATNIPWVKQNDVYTFENLTLKVPRGCVFVLLESYDEKVYDVYLSLITKDNIRQEIKSGAVCSEPVYVSSEDSNFRPLTQEIVDTCVRIVNATARNNRRNLLGPVNFTTNERISENKVGDQILYLRGRIAGGIVYTIQSKYLLNLLANTSKFRGDENDFIETGNTNPGLKTFIELDKAITLAAQTLFDTGVCPYTSNPYIVAGLEELGFKRNQGDYFTFKV